MIALILVNRKRRANCFPVVMSETALFFQKIKLLFVKDCLMIVLLCTTRKYKYDSSTTSSINNYWFSLTKVCLLTILDHFN